MHGTDGSVSTTNKQGQSIGRKGADTRQKLLDATRQLLLSEMRLTVASIAKVSGMSSATFYLYFSDANDVLLALSDAATQDMNEIHAILNQQWDYERLDTLSRQFVDAFYAHWNRHRAVLTVRNFQSDLGSRSFSESRRRAAMPVIRSVAQRIRDAHGHDRLAETDAIALSVIIYAAIERLAGRNSTSALQSEDLTDEQLIRAEAHILTLLFRPAR